MKRKGIFILATIFLLVLLSILWICRRGGTPGGNSVFYNIPTGSKIVATIDITSLSYLLTSEYLINPEDVSSLKDRFSDNKVVSELGKDLNVEGLALSPKILFFTTGDSTGDAYFIIAPVKDYKTVSKNMTSYLKGNSFKLQSQEYKGYYSDSLKTFVAWNEKALLVGFSNVKEAKLQQKAWEEINESKGMSPNDSTTINRLIEGEEHAILWLKDDLWSDNLGIIKHSQNNIFSIDFKKGSLVFNAELDYSENTNEPFFLGSRKTRTFRDTSMMKFQVSVNEENGNTLSQWISEKKYHLLDSSFQRLMGFGFSEFEKSWNGYLDIELNGKSTIKEHYVTYEYDDDFNKVEKESIVTHEVFDFSSFIGSDTDNLYKVLNQHGNLKKKGKSMLLGSIPIQDIYVSDLDSGLILSSPKIFSETAKIEKSEYPVSFFADVTRLNELKGGPIFNNPLDQFLEEVDHVAFHARETDPGRFELEFSIYFKKEKINSLITIANILIVNNYFGMEQMPSDPEN